ncbi:GNAT family N-acetyltransferase [Enterovibrio coralii]|uniref:GNAT family acetyltransferase n=1 Tax=Enterovibrio coralii TaxID=294935 RepID=A0A135I8A3_9GAMM|nr:GNAT family N-acetyltransferase [Enterovibrio coralii]KXF81681.1 GNAT family acetyltransferase [Enterovibrio coralii]
MLTFDAFKQGHAVSLKDGYTIALISKADLEDIIEMLQNPKVTEYLFFAPAPEEMYRGYFGPIIEGTEQAIANNEWPETITVIIRDNDGKYMGMCGLPAVMFLSGNYEVGFQFAEHAWGKGLASSGCEFLLALAFDELGAHKVTADCYRANVGSYKTMEKAGLVEEGCQIAYFKTENGFDDRLLYGITKAQYDAKTVV